MQRGGVATCRTPSGEQTEVVTVDRWLQECFVEGAEASIAAQLLAYGKFYAYDITHRSLLSGLILGLHPANERRCYKVMPSLSPVLY